MKMQKKTSFRAYCIDFFIISSFTIRISDGFVSFIGWPWSSLSQGFLKIYVWFTIISVNYIFAIQSSCGLYPPVKRISGLRRRMVELSSTSPSLTILTRLWTTLLMQSLRSLTFPLLAPRFKMFRMERDDDSITTWQLSLPVADTLIFTFSENGESHAPWRASIVYIVLLHSTLENCVLFILKKSQIA